MNIQPDMMDLLKAYGERHNFKANATSLAQMTTLKRKKRTRKEQEKNLILETVAENKHRGVFE